MAGVRDKYCEEASEVDPSDVCKDCKLSTEDTTRAEAVDAKCQEGGFW